MKNFSTSKTKIYLLTLIAIALVYGFIALCIRDYRTRLSMELIAAEKQASEDLINYPLNAYLPWITTDYSVDYLREKTLLITPLKYIDRETVLAEVKRWIIDKDINPESHSYVFVIF